MLEWSLRNEFHEIREELLESIKFSCLLVCLFVSLVLVGLADSLFYSVLNLIKMTENHPWLTTGVVFQFVDCFDRLAMTSSNERVWQQLFSAYRTITGNGWPLYTIFSAQVNRISKERIQQNVVHNSFYKIMAFHQDDLFLNFDLLSTGYYYFRSAPFWKRVLRAKFVLWRPVSLVVILKLSKRSIFRGPSDM